MKFIADQCGIHCLTELLVKNDEHRNVLRSVLEKMANNDGYFDIFHWRIVQKSRDDIRLPKGQPKEVETGTKIRLRVVEDLINDHSNVDDINEKFLLENVTKKCEERVRKKMNRIAAQFVEFERKEICRKDSSCIIFKEKKVPEVNSGTTPTLDYERDERKESLYKEMLTSRKAIVYGIDPMVWREKILLPFLFGNRKGRQKKDTIYERGLAVFWKVVANEMRNNLQNKRIEEKKIPDGATKSEKLDIHILHKPLEKGTKIEFFVPKFDKNDPVLNWSGDMLRGDGKTDINDKARRRVWKDFPQKWIQELNSCLLVFARWRQDLIRRDWNQQVASTKLKTHQENREERFSFSHIGRIGHLFGSGSAGEFVTQFHRLYFSMGTTGISGNESNESTKKHRMAFGWPNRVTELVEGVEKGSQLSRKEDLVKKKHSADRYDSDVLRHSLMNFEISPGVGTWYDDIKARLREMSFKIVCWNSFVRNPTSTEKAARMSECIAKKTYGHNISLLPEVFRWKDDAKEGLFPELVGGCLRNNSHLFVEDLQRCFRCSNHHHLIQDYLSFISSTRPLHEEKKNNSIITKLSHAICMVAIPSKSKEIREFVELAKVECDRLSEKCVDKQEKKENEEKKEGPVSNLLSACIQVVIEDQRTIFFFGNHRNLDKFKEILKTKKDDYCHRFRNVFAFLKGLEKTCWMNWNEYGRKLSSMKLMAEEIFYSEKCDEDSFRNKKIIPRGISQKENIEVFLTRIYEERIDRSEKLQQRTRKNVIDESAPDEKRDDEELCEELRLLRFERTLLGKKFKDYEVIRAIGGANLAKQKGEVFYGVNSGVYHVRYQGRDLAMKIVLNYDKGNDADETIRTRMIRTEFENVANLPYDENICRCHSCFIDTFQTKDLPGWDKLDSTIVHTKTAFFIFPLYKQSLKDLIEKKKYHILFGRWKKIWPPISIETIYRLIRDVCNAILVMKKHNLVHRDLKFDNIFINVDKFVVGDFGVCLSVNPEFEVAFGDCHCQGGVGPGGGSHYMCPEVRFFDGRSSSIMKFDKYDIYSLGMMCYELFSEKHPFGGDSKSQIMNENNYVHLKNCKDEVLRELIKDMLNPDREKRVSAKEVIERIDADQKGKK